MKLRGSTIAVIGIALLTACTTQSPSATPSGTASPPEISFSSDAVAKVAQAFYDEYLNCMTNPPAEATGQVGNWCASNNSHESPGFPANLEAGGVAAAGADPIVCAQSFPISYSVSDANYEPVGKSGTAIITEKFGSGDLKVAVILINQSKQLIVDNIICPN